MCNFDIGEKKRGIRRQKNMDITNHDFTISALSFFWNYWFTKGKKESGYGVHCFCCCGCTTCVVMVCAGCGIYTGRNG